MHEQRQLGVKPDEVVGAVMTGLMRQVSVMKRPSNAGAHQHDRALPSAAHDRSAAQCTTFSIGLKNCRWIGFSKVYYKLTRVHFRVQQDGDPFS